MSTGCKGYTSEFPYDSLKFLTWLTHSYHQW